MKRKIIFKREHILRIDGVEKRFHPGDLAEIQESEARELIQKKIAVPGPQEGRTIRMFG